MLKYIYLLFLISNLFFITGNVSAQSNIDSLLQRLKTETGSANQITLLQQIGDRYSTKQPDTAIVFYNQAIQKCNSRDLLAIKAGLLNKKGKILTKKGDDNAISIFSNAKECYTELGDTLGIAQAEKSKGIAYFYQKKFDESLTHYGIALTLYEKIGNPANQAKVLNNIAVLYRMDEKYDRAIDIYQQSLVLKEDLKDSIGIGTTLMNLGSLYVDAEEKALFEAHIEKASTIFKAKKNKALTAKCNLAYGRGLLQFEDWAAAKIYLQEAFTYYQDQPHNHYYEVTLNQLGRIAMHEKDFERAISLFETGLAQNRKNGRRVMIEAHLRSLSLAKFELKEYQSAYLYLEEAYALQDSNRMEKRDILTQELQTKFDVQQKDAALKIKNLELAEQRKSKKTFMLICGLLSLLLLNGLYTIFQKNKHNKLLSAKHQLLETAFSEKDLLVKEIHHRVKNNLQFISSLLSLQSRHITDKNAIAALESSQNRVQSMSLLHRNLYQKDHLASVNMKVYLEQLILTNLQAYGVATSNIEVKKDIAPIVLDIDRAVPIGLIINELVNNIFKHAFPNQSNGVVFVGFQQKEEKLIVTVKDNGKGVSMSTSTTLANKSFGLKLINLLVKKLNATWKMSGNNGTSVLLEVPF